MYTQYQGIHNTYDLLKGDINRMFVSDDKDEVTKSMYYALNRLNKIWKYNLDRFEEKQDG